MEVEKLVSGKKKLLLPSSFTQDSLPNTFASYFEEKIVLLRAGLAPEETLSVQLYESCSSKFMDFQVLTSGKVSKLLQKARTKSCNLDPIPTVILKNCLDPLVKIITSIFNKSLNSGIVPSAFKSALVFPVLKKPSLDPEVLGNYRPISNLPFLSKVIERAVAEQLHNYLETNHLYSRLQSAYRKHHSTETALLRVHNDILTALDKGSQVAVVLLDFSSAFDTLDHRILLSRLQHRFGISGVVLKWFEHYLSSRTQSVYVNGKFSSPAAISYGVPQGSVLGPLLFTLYISPLEDIISAHKVSAMFYADDSKLYLTLDSSNMAVTSTQIENCIKDIKIWTTNNKLIFNDTKSEVLRIVSKFNKSPTTFPGIMINSTLVPPVANARDLGVILDHNLSMEPHINSMCKSASFALHKIGRIRKYLDKSTCETLIHAFVTSRLDSCNSLLYGLPSRLLTKLQRIQNTAARLVYRIKKTEHITPFLKNLHWLPVQKNIEYKLILMTYKILHGLCPIYLADLIDVKIPSRPLRSQANGISLIVPRSHKASFGDRAFSVAAPTLWNRLPRQIKEADSLESFKSRLKTFLFSTAF